MLENLMLVLRFIFVCFEVLFVFNLLVIVHELGHYWAAKWRGMVVEKFAVWFGPSIWKKTINGVDWSLGCIPAGGYVVLPQMADMEMLEGETKTPREKLPKVKPIDKIIVAFAGPLFSFSLAVLFAIVVWNVGRPVSEAEKTTTIGYVAPDASGAKGADPAIGGLRAGDEIELVDGQPVQRFVGAGNSVQWRVMSSEGSVINFTVLRDGKSMVIPVVPEKDMTRAWYQRAAPRTVGISGRYSVIVDVAKENSPIALAGVKHGDIIAAINGIPIISMGQVVDMVKDNGAKEMTLTIRRLRGLGKDATTETFEVPVTPRAPNPIAGKPDLPPMLGFAQVEGGLRTIAYPNPIEQIYASVTAIANTLTALVSPKSDIKLNQLSGPAGMMRFYYLLFEMPDGWKMVLWFSVLINVNLALVNLLPIPVLDGGHIVMGLLEMIRGRTLDPRLMSIVQSACAILIIGYMVYISGFDVQDYFPGGSRGGKNDVSFSPPTGRTTAP